MILPSFRKTSMENRDENAAPSLHPQIFFLSHSSPLLSLFLSLVSFPAAVPGGFSPQIFSAASLSQLPTLLSEVLPLLSPNLFQAVTLQLLALGSLRHFFGSFLSVQPYPPLSLILFP